MDYQLSLIWIILSNLWKTNRKPDYRQKMTLFLVQAIFQQISDNTELHRSPKYYGYRQH